LTGTAAAHAAVDHVREGLALERDPYRRGQLLLWGSRAARRVDPAQALRWRGDLDTLSGVDDLQAEARRPWRGRAPHINLMMVDAY
jgi:hypothetical protein